jgi:hypothetical protein
MPRYQIRMVNSEFESFDEGEFPSLDAARQTAIASATKVASEAVGDGIPTAAVEVEIREGQVVVARQVVTLSVADLMGGEPAQH